MKTHHQVGVHIHFKLSLWFRVVLELGSALFSIVVPLREWGSSSGEVPGVGSLLPACTSTDAATFFGI